MDFVGYSTGTAINKTADITADVAKHGIDIAVPRLNILRLLIIATDNSNTKNGDINKKYITY